MKIGYWLQIIFIFLEVTVFLTDGVECFTIPISVSTGMAIIIALVKVKAVIVKVLLGLKAMGYDSFVWRTSRRRRATGVGLSVLESSMFLQDELLEAWNDLQQTVGKVIQFDLDSCLAASLSRSGGLSEQHRHVFSFESIPENQELIKAREKEYSTWVSKTLGSSIKDPLACQILAEQLQQPFSTNSSNSTLGTTS